MTTYVISHLRSGPYEFWNLHLNGSVANVLFDLTLRNTTVGSWCLALKFKSEISISESRIGWISLDFYSLSVRIDDLKPGFHENLNLGSLIFVNSSVDSWTIRIVEANVTVHGSNINLIFHGKSQCLASDSNIVSAFMSGFSGNIHFSESVVTGWISIRDSDFSLTGDLGFTKVGIKAYSSSNVTRNYNVIVRNMSDNPVENVELLLFSQNYTVIWSGTSDSLGQTDFNLTFADNNYIDTLRLEAVKGNYSATMNVGFLSDTPVVLTMRYFADLNGDGTVNIVDLFIVAKAFGTKEGDENYNPNADLDGNKEINIIDLYEVAKDYGKTV